ncbi:Thiol-disulfide isomerase or thioredoxin [Mariprofundus ferrinatatus]|uniref:Thiol-disulfide isomerase or thioredoxin n=1 Tax=Mariprofundus ferrinatatus TaxID=1921087 RepID=A0A2K8L1M9_9PROT|nr:TlpA disulfide reductase family protein [Mariprofundus ferrinatatus]ATX81225.1 Thiol-disulfide isomerase or thioredoxin [Mariprofundus ferrinatatus]
MIRWFAALMLVLFSWVPAHAADFKWMDESGTTYSLDELKGEPVLVHFWASWCPSCRAEMPAYSEWVSNHPDIKVLSVSLDQKTENAEKFLNETGIETALLLSDEIQARKLGAQALPTTIVINADGDISQIHRGPRDWKNSEFSDQLLEVLLPEVQSAPLHSGH